jgi:hypothetical protein
MELICSHIFPTAWICIILCGTYRWRNTEPVGIGTHEQLFMGYVSYIHSSRISLVQIFSSIRFQRVSNRCRGEVFYVQLFIRYMSYILHTFGWLKYFPLSVSREYRTGVEEKSSLFSCSLDTCILHAYPWLKYFPLFCFQRVSNRCRGEVFFGYVSYILHAYPWLTFFPLSVSREYRRSVEERSSLFSC